MALTALQQHVCGLLAERRIDDGEAYLADGTALDAILDAPRASRDIDRFHDSVEAVRVSSESDRALLVAKGLVVDTTRELRGFVEAVVRDRDGAAVVLEWVQETALRFFPLVEHPTAPRMPRVGGERQGRGDRSWVSPRAGGSDGALHGGGPRDVGVRRRASGCR